MTAAEDGHGRVKRKWVPAEAGDEPSAEDAPTAAAAAAGVVPHLLMILIESTSTGGDGRGGSYVAADI